MMQKDNFAKNAEEHGIDLMLKNWDIPFHTIKGMGSMMAPKQDVSDAIGMTPLSSENI